MESTFDALNPGKFADFTDQKIRFIKRKYAGIALIAGVAGLIIGGVIVYEFMREENNY